MGSCFLCAKFARSPVQRREQLTRFRRTSTVAFSLRRGQQRRDRHPKLWIEGSVWNNAFTKLTMCIRLEHAHSATTAWPCTVCVFVYRFESSSATSKRLHAECLESKSSPGRKDMRRWQQILNTRHLLERNVILSLCHYILFFIRSDQTTIIITVQVQYLTYIHWRIHTLILTSG